MKLHILHCGTIRVSETVPYGNRIDLKNTGRQLLTPDEKRLTLPVCCYLLEHPKGPILVDAGWCRELSPSGVYDREAARKVLPPALEAFYRPALPEGMAVDEQLRSMGIRPGDLNCVLLTHLDPDHVAGLKHLRGAKRILVAEDEYFWSCRAVYKARQPWSLWMDVPMEHFWYRGSPTGPNRWAFDLFGDETVQLVNVPGHTDGQAAVIIRNGEKFVLLAADAAFSRRNWEEMITPGFGLFRGRQLKSLEWIRGMAQDPDCAAVLCSHDPECGPGVIDF